ncbi:MAG: SulP family inorganic anion transporter [Chloroflexi bacterium]|nr:SulP family inorganic anion transporter [Chloroflexota bacterium]
MTAPVPSRPTARRWPVLDWVPGYQRSWLRLDIIAGLTVCAILVPEGMAYAGLAGVPPEAAFYAAPIGLLAYAVLGSSRQLVVAVSSAVAIMSAATISQLAPAGTAEYVTLTAALALLAGLLSIAAGVLKLGRIAQFFSESVLIGFVFGLALLISIKQIPKLLGIEAEGESAVELVLALVPQLTETHAVTLAVGAIGIAALVLLERTVPRMPAALVVLLGSIAASVAFALEGKGVAVVGNLPAGLVSPSLPGAGLETLPLLFAGAAGIGLVAFAEAIGPANEFAQKHGGRVDPNRELIAIGAANTGAGLFSGFPIGSSLSKSAANDRAGARTPASLVAAAAATAFVALFLTPLFEPLPEATLGAVVIVAVAGMMKVGRLRRLWNLRRLDFWLAMIALVGVLVAPTLEALALAVVVSLGAMVWRASEPRLTFLGRPKGYLEPVDLESQPTAAIPGLLVVRPDEMLFFANATAVRDAIVLAARETEPRPTVVLLDLSLTRDADVPAVEALEDLQVRLASDGIALWLSHVRPKLLALLERAGAIETIGRDHVYPRIADGLMDFALGTAGARARVDVLADVVAYLRERRMQEGTSPEGLEMLAALEARLEMELAAEDGNGTDPAGPP